MLLLRGKMRRFHWSNVMSTCEETPAGTCHKTENAPKMIPDQFSQVPLMYQQSSMMDINNTSSAKIDTVLQYKKEARYQHLVPAQVTTTSD